MPFWSRSTQERELEAIYYNVLLNYPLFNCNPGNAKSLAREVLALGKERAKEERGLPERFGDFILQRQDSDSHARQMLETRRSDGVTDRDFLWWWNQSALERGVMLAFDDIMRVTLWQELRTESGLTEEQATAEVRKRVVNYGNPGGTSSEPGDDRPIPFELKDRVNRWLYLHAKQPEELATKMAKTSSMNALIRAELRAGRI